MILSKFVPTQNRGTRTTNPRGERRGGEAGGGKERERRKLAHWVHTVKLYITIPEVVLVAISDAGAQPY